MDTVILYKWSTIAYILIAVAAVYWAYHAIRNKLEDMRQQEELAELEFENSLYTSATLDTQHTQEFLEQSTPVLEGTPTAPSPAPLFSADLPQKSDILNHSIMQKLNAAGLVKSVEFFRDHHGQEKGLVAVKLRNGKIALIVPTWESDAFIQRYEKQVDLIIMPGADGRACVITPFTTLISDSVTF